MLEITYNSGNLIIGDGPEYVGLDEIIFYIPKQFYEYKMFAVLKQGTQLDTLELKQSNSTKRLYYNYQVEYYPVKLKNGNCEIQIFGINLTNGKSFFSDKVVIKIVNEDYNFKSSIYIMEKFNKIASNVYDKMCDIYNKFVDLSNINGSILQEIDERGVK